ASRGWFTVSPPAARRRKQDARLGGRHVAPRGLDRVRTHRDGIDAMADEPLRILGVHRRSLPANGNRDPAPVTSANDATYRIQYCRVSLVEERSDHPAVAIDAEHELGEVVGADGDAGGAQPGVFGDPVDDGGDFGHHPQLEALPGFESGLLHDLDRKSTRLNSSHVKISYAVFCLKKQI